MSTDLLGQLAGYNRWANARLYAFALALPEEAFRRPVGVFFGSLHGTLNHLLATDRIWLRRLTGKGEAPDRLDAIVCEDRIALTRARIAEDARLIAVVDGFDEVALAGRFAYRSMNGAPQEGSRGETLLHVFNHQTHHRGHAHACCSIVTGKEPPSLDLVAYQRGAPAPDLAALL